MPHAGPEGRENLSEVFTGPGGYRGNPILRRLLAPALPIIWVSRKVVLECSQNGVQSFSIMSTVALSLLLTKSRVRGDVLTLFFLNPEEPHYLRELQRRFGCALGSLARELRRFAQDGLLLREKRGKEIFYRLNKAHPLFREIKGIVEKTSGIPLRLAEGLRPLKSIRRAYLYGSFAKDNAAAHSDIDLLLVGEETPSSRKLLKDLEARFGRSINASVFTEREFEAKRKDPAEFLFAVLRGPLIPLKPELPSHGPDSAP